MPPLIGLSVAWLSGLFSWPLAIASLGALSPAPRAVTCMAVMAFAVASLVVVGRGRNRDIPWFGAVCGAVLVAAMLHGWATSVRQHGCAVLLSREAVVHVALDERLAVAREAGARAPGARGTGRAPPPRTVRGLARGDGPLSHCRLPATVRIRTDSASPRAPVAGDVVAVRGTVRTGTRGGAVALRVEGTAIGIVGHDRLRGWRGRAGEHIDRLFGADAPVVRALLIADQDGIAPATRDRFADAGLVHMLSISGLHVAIVAGALLVLASSLRIPYAIAAPFALAAVTVYVLTLGAPPPAVRSAVMLAVVSASELAGRPVHPWTALALGAVVPTVDPLVVRDLGWQLSVGGMASLVAARAMLRGVRLAEPWPRRTARGATRWRRRMTRWRRAAVEWVQGLSGWRWTLLRETVTGIVATLVTAPLVAWTFGRVSLIAPLSNIVAGPVVAFLQPLLFLAMALVPWDAGARFAASASSPALLLLDRIASVSASVPHAALHVAPTLAGAALAGIAAAAFVRGTAAAPGSSARRACATIAVTACGAGVWLPLLLPGSGRLELHVLDVGQGDAIAVRTPAGRWVIMDAGRIWDGGDAGRRTVVPYVRRLGGRVAAFVLSHPHDDHAGGAASVVRDLRPAAWWEPAFVTTSPGYVAALRAVQEHGVPWRRVGPGDRLSLDGAILEVLAPDSAWTAAQHDANESSVVLRVRYGRTTMLLTGDAESGEEEWLVRTLGDGLRADVLKLGHHGSRTSTSEPFLEKVRPRLAIASVGADNRYGHPSPEVVGRLASRGIPLLRTDADGTVVISTDGRDVTVLAGGHRWALPADDSAPPLQ